MTLEECVARHSHRQMRMAVDWLDREWNNPGRTDYYLMQIAAEVRRVLHKQPDKVHSEHFKIVFTREKKQPKKKITKEDAARIAKAKVFAFFPGIINKAKETAKKVIHGAGNRN